MPSHNRDFASILALAVLLTASPGLAATIEKADNAVDLDLPGSWVGGVVPGSSSFVGWDSTVTGPNLVALGSDMSFLNLQVTNPGGDVTIAADGHRLTVGGIDMSLATRNLTINADLALTSKEIWNVPTTLALNGNLDATVSTSSNLFKRGSGTLILGGVDIFSTNATGSSLVFSLDAGTVQLGNDYALHAWREGLVLNSTVSILDLAGHDALIGAMSGSGNVVNSGTRGATLTFVQLSVGSNNTFSGNLSDGGMPLGVTMAGLGLEHWLGVNTYTGNTTVARGTLDIAGTSSIASGSTLVLAGGILNQSASATQSFADTVVVAGASAVMQGAGARILNLGNIDRSSPGGTVLFTPSSTGGIFTSTPLASSGILGGWALFSNGATFGWATRDTSNATSALTRLPLNQMSSTFAPGMNTNLTSNLTVGPSASTASLASLSSSSTITLNGANVIESGGILTGGLGAQLSLTINSLNATDSLTSGNGHDLIVNAYGNVTINARLIDNGGTPIALTKNGPFSLSLTGANTYSGGTFLNSGTLYVAAGSSLGTGPVAITYEGGTAGVQLVLGPDVYIPGDITASDGGSLQTFPLVNVPAGSATLGGSYVTRGPDQYRISLTGGTLTLLGTHTAGTPDPNGQSPGTLLGGTNGSAIIFAGTGSLTSYGAPLKVQFDVPAFSLTLRDDARITIINPGVTTGLDMGNGVANNSGTMTLTMADRANVDLGTSNLDVRRGGAAVSVLNLDGGTLRLGAFVKSTVFAGNVSTMNFNGTTIVAAASSSSFLPAFLSGSSQTLTGIVRAGGARFDTGGFNITVGLSLSRDATLGSVPDGGIVKLGSGTLTLSYSTSMYTGPTVIQQGMLVAQVSTSPTSIHSITGPGDFTLSGAPNTLTSDGVVVNQWTINRPQIVRSGTRIAGTSKINALTINFNPATQGWLDLTDNKLILESNGDTDKSAKEVLLQSYLRSGMGNGNWLGAGITSSTVAADNSATGSHMTALALYDNAVLKLPTFGGLPVDDGSLMITTALQGDANDDNVVDLLDASIVANHWQTAQHSWSAGDLNDDGFVDLLDLTVIANHWQQTYTPPVFAGAPAEDEGGFVSVPVSVPEPASLLLLAPLWLVCRRRRAC